MMPAVGQMKVMAGAAAGAPSSEQSGSSRSDCTDCSHCTERPRTGNRAGAGVRVSVDLRHFFSDRRARAFMWAPYGRCVQWLCRRMSRVFALPDDIALLCRGHMLPVIEPLLMLDHDDPIEVVSMSYMFTPQDKQSGSNVSNQKTINDKKLLIGQAESNVASIQANITMKKENMIQLPTSNWSADLTENQNNPRVSLISMETTTGSPESTNANESKELQRLKQRALRLLDKHYNVLEEASAPKRLRRRRRRRKLQTVSAVPDASDDEEPQPGDSAVLRNGSGPRPPRLVRALSPSLIQQ